jgi:putative PIN family toxin of toxin-antitoxin system
VSLRLVVLDTNILVSAGLRADGSEAKVLDLVLEDELILLTCPEIVDEYREVLSRSKFKRFGFPPRWLDQLLKLGHHRTDSPPPWPMPGPDADDLVFLALAHLMDATLITGNLKDFPTELTRGTSVLNARTFLARHKQP